jgi:hypothetical protein
VPVAVKGHGYADWSHKVLDQFRVNAASKEQGSARVPEIVPAGREETRAFLWSSMNKGVAL